MMTCDENSLVNFFRRVRLEVQSIRVVPFVHTRHNLAQSPIKVSVQRLVGKASLDLLDPAFNSIQ